MCAMTEITEMPHALELRTTCGAGKTRTRKGDELSSSSSDEEMQRQYSQ